VVDRFPASGQAFADPLPRVSIAGTLCTISARTATGLRSPLRAHEGHQNKVNSRRVRKLKSPPHSSLFGKAVRRVDVSRARIIDQNIQPESMCARLRKDPDDHSPQEDASQSLTRCNDRDALQANVTMRVIQIAKNCESNRFITRGADQICIFRIADRCLMFFLTPSTDHFLKTGFSLGRHDERNIGRASTSQINLAHLFLLSFSNLVWQSQ
jgi:hypothetical protein